MRLHAAYDAPPGTTGSRLIVDWTHDPAFARLGLGVRRSALLAAAHPMLGVALIWSAASPGTVTRRGSRGDCPLDVALPTSPSHRFEAEQEKRMEQVIIGVDPHKLSATIEVVDRHENLLGSGRFTTDQPGYAAMRT